MKDGRVIQTKRLKIIEVAPDVFACITPNKGWGWVNAGFITRGKGLVYDTFFDLPHCREMLEVFQQLTGRKAPGTVVNSHYNGDHIFGNQLFGESTIIMHKEVLRERLTEPVEMYQNIQANTGKPGFPEWFQFFHEQFSGIDFRGIEWRQPDIMLDNGANIDIYLEGIRAQVLNVAPAHSDSDLLLWLPEERVVFCGDVVFSGGGIVAYSEAGMRKWAAALDTIIELNPRVVVPGHGGLCDVEHIKELREYFDVVLDEFDKHYDPDLDPLDIAKKINVEKFINWLQPERLMTIVNALVRGRKGLAPSQDWENNMPRMNALEEYYNQRYKDIKKPWDPMSSWNAPVPGEA